MKARREYPSRPLVGAGAVVANGRRVLLVKRRFPPNEGRWALPGGLVELGERVQDAVVREVKEETGLDVELVGLLDVATDIHLDGRSRPRYHYILVDYLARPAGPGVEVRLNSESSASGWFSEEQTKRLDMSAGTRNVLRMHFERAKAPAMKASTRGSL